MVNKADILGSKILIVDDMEPNLILLERTLLGAGYTSITVTTNPTKVCELYHKNHYDLIMLDIQMPVMDGFQIMESLREIEKDDFPPILVITAEPNHKLKAIQAGAKDFVSKPFELIEVLTRVHNMLEAHLLKKDFEEHKEDNPALSGVIQQNIRKIINLRLKSTRDKSTQDRTADTITIFSGSMIFLYVHIIWFCIWILINTGRIGIHAFDPYPYGLLTMIVSLEAIFLSTFVLISQNILRKESERLADLGLHTELLTEHELTRVLQMLHAIQTKIGITNDENSNIADADLEMETKPEDILSEIDRLQHRAIKNIRLKS